MRAKLTNLVDDTNDMNNFDTAMLRCARTEVNARPIAGQTAKLTD